jgi:hypothetical protein
MTLKHSDIFHCQKCGRMTYQTHGAEAPSCCGEFMQRAVAGVLHEAHEATEATTCKCEEPKPGALKDDAIFSELAELSKWCTSVIDEDGSRYNELASRLKGVHELMLDRFEAEDRSGDLDKLADVRRDLAADIAHVRRQRRDLLEALNQLITDLLRGEDNFRGWEEVRERFASLVAGVKNHKQKEAALERSLPAKNQPIAEKV